MTASLSAAAYAAATLSGDGADTGGLRAMPGGNSRAPLSPTVAAAAAAKEAQDSKLHRKTISMDDVMSSISGAGTSSTTTDSDRQKRGVWRGVHARGAQVLNFTNPLLSAAAGVDEPTTLNASTETAATATDIATATADATTVIAVPLSVTLPSLLTPNYIAVPSPNELPPGTATAGTTVVMEVPSVPTLTALQPITLQLPVSLSTAAAVGVNASQPADMSSASAVSATVVPVSVVLPSSPIATLSTTTSSAGNASSSQSDALLSPSALASSSPTSVGATANDFALPTLAPMPVLLAPLLATPTASDALSTGTVSLSSTSFAPVQVVLPAPDSSTSE